MKRIFLLLIIELLLSNSRIDTVWIDHSISKMNWTGYKITGSHNGQIKIKEGYIIKNDDLILGGKITIDMESISVEDIKNSDSNQYLVNHLKNEDFFNVNVFPIATLDILSSKLISANDKNNSNIEIAGNLTIKNITNRVLIYSYVDLSNNLSNGELIVDRTKWDIKYGSNTFYDLGDRAIYDDFLLEFQLLSKD